MVYNRNRYFLFWERAVSFVCTNNARFSQFPMETLKGADVAERCPLIGVPFA